MNSACMLKHSEERIGRVVSQLQNGWRHTTETKTIARSEAQQCLRRIEQSAGELKGGGATIPDMTSPPQTVRQMQYAAFSEPNGTGDTYTGTASSLLCFTRNYK